MFIAKHFTHTIKKKTLNLPLRYLPDDMKMIENIQAN